MENHINTVWWYDMFSCEDTTVWNPMFDSVRIGYTSLVSLFVHTLPHSSIHTDTKEGYNVRTVNTLLIGSFYVIFYLCRFSFATYRYIQLADFHDSFWLWYILRACYTANSPKKQHCVENKQNTIPCTTPSSPNVYSAPDCFCALF